MKEIKRRLLLIIVVGLMSTSALFAQGTTPQSSSGAALVVTVSGANERLRFTGPSTVVQMHLQVYDEMGQLLSELNSEGNVLDWNLQDSAGVRLSNGSYVTVVTVKSLSGQVSRRMGSVAVVEKQTELRPIDATQLTAPQQQSVGPIENDAALTILKPSEGDASTVIAHDGSEGQMIRGRGALSFRIGDFFSGNDQEQMRLTEDGRLGIGTSTPQTKLDVAGTIRAQRVLIVKPRLGGDNKLLAGNTAQSTDTLEAGQPLASGTGTQNQLAKWLDNSGTLGDSVLTENGGKIGVGTTNPAFKLDLVDDTSGAGGFQLANNTNGTFAQLQNRLVNNNGALAYYGITSSGYTQAPILSNRAFFGSYQIDTVIWTQTANDILFATNGLGANTERMRITSGGNVGIGTTAPSERLHVIGNGLFTGNLTVNGTLSATLPAGSSNYVQNTESPQPASNFNISGNGTAGGILTGNSVNAVSQYNISGNRVLSIAGANNTFGGVDAGTSNTSGQNNSFFGNGAGLRNTTGTNNSFFGTSAGMSNTTGGGNSFFGLSAGGHNTTAGDNSFFGAAAGIANTTGNSNSFFGSFAGSANTTASNNSFFGDDAGLNNTTGGGNSFFGSGSGQSNTTGGSNSFFGQNAGNSNTSGGNNSFFGAAAGVSTTTGSANSVFGTNAGFNNTTGNANSFFGNYAGNANIEGTSNSFFGANAGQANTNGSYNSFFGINAGNTNTNGGLNSFFGASAGQANTTGQANAFFGENAGISNTIASGNSFFGQNSGSFNTTGGNNTFIGATAGGHNTTGNSNVVIGSVAGSNLSGDNNVYIANPGVANESNAIRIGAGGVQTAVYFPGIGSSVVTGSGVLISATGQLGVAASSRRYKKDIRDMGNASSRLMQLRPVTFLYRPEFVHGDQTLQYGLIAEEVAKIYPELVEYSADGRPQTVRYHLLSTMLLNEVQKQQRTIQSLHQQSAAVQAENLALKTRLDRLERSVRKLHETYRHSATRREQR